MKKRFKNYPAPLFICACASALLTSAALSVDELSLLCLVSLVPLIGALTYYKAAKRLSVCGAMFTYSFLYHFLSVLWLLPFGARIEGLSAALGVPLMFLASVVIGLIEGAITALAFAPCVYLRRSRVPFFLIFAALYIVAEALQEYLPEVSFPWCRLGVIMADVTPFIQSASLFGSLFISLLILLINGLIAQAAVLLLGCFLPSRSSARGRRAVRLPAGILCLACAAAVFAADYGFGAARIARREASPQIVRVAAVQGGLAMQDKWDMTLSQTVSEYLELSAAAVSDGAQIILWPETAVPADITDSCFERIAAFASENDVTIVTGAFASERDGRRNLYYNVLCSVGPDGEVSEPYIKRRLVPMGERMPFSGLIDYGYTEPYQNLTPGSEPVLLPVDGLLAAGVVCYDSIYASSVRDNVAAGAQLILMSSNDSWFADTPAMEEHFDNSVMRAVENGRWIARSGNTGVTAFIDNLGRVVGRCPTDLRTYMLYDVGLFEEQTLYTRVGDVVLIPCVLLCIAAAAFIFRRERREERC